MILGCISETLRNAYLFEESLRGLALQKRLDEAKQQLGLGDNSGVRSRRQDGKPLYVKVAMGIMLDSDEPERTIIRAEWRIHALSEQSRKRFTPYWRIIGPFSHYIQRSMIKAAQKRAERTVAAG